MRWTIRFPLILLLGATLAGCAAAPLRHYEGAPRPSTEVAIVSLPEALEVVRIDGAAPAVLPAGWNRGTKTLELLPGRHELLVYYREIWALGNSHDVLRSQPARFVVDAVAGARYVLDYERPQTYSAAQALAADFRGWVADAAGARHASQPSGLRFRDGLTAGLGRVPELVAETPTVLAVAPMASTARPAAATAAASPVSATEAAPAAARTATGEAAEWLPLMQNLWKQADEAERSAFLRWLAEQPR